MTDAINSANAELGMTQDFWEHRSFKEQGLDIIPQIHLGEKASAMERAGIQTIRGNINRDIIKQNAIINAARMAVEKAKEELEAVKAIPVAVIKAFKNEIIDMIRRMCERNNNRLTLPVVKGKYIGEVSDCAALQDKDKMEAYVQSKGWTTFDEMQADRKALQAEYDRLEKSDGVTSTRMDYLQGLIDFCEEKYEPYHKFNVEYWKLKGAEDKNGKHLGFFKKSKAEEYKRQHQTELNTFRMYKNILKDMIKEPDKKIVPKKWKEEVDRLDEKSRKTEKAISNALVDLAKMEVLIYNKRDLERMLENERHQPSRSITKKRNDPSI